jgi:hypothetical protein
MSGAGYGAAIGVQVRHGAGGVLPDFFDEAIARSPLPVDESGLQTSFGTTRVLAAGDPSNPSLVQ